MDDSDVLRADPDGGPGQQPSALVTGGTSGIGLATAQALLDSGYGVLVCGRDVERGRAALERLGATRPVSSVAADVTDEEDVAVCWPQPISASVAWI